MGLMQNPYESPQTISTFPWDEWKEVRNINIITSLISALMGLICFFGFVGGIAAILMDIHVPILFMIIYGGLSVGLLIATKWSVKFTYISHQMYIRKIKYSTRTMAIAHRITNSYSKCNYKR